MPGGCCITSSAQTKHTGFYVDLADGRYQEFAASHHQLRQSTQDSRSARIIIENSSMRRLTRFEISPQHVHDIAIFW